MRKLDFGVQTLLFGLTLVALSAGLLIEMGYLLFGGITMFLIGVWQLLSAAATSFNQKHGNAYRTRSIRLYWIFVLVYFVVLLVFGIMGLNKFALIWFYVAWGIAIYYYVFTIRLAFPAERKTFMDVVS